VNLLPGGGTTIQVWDPVGQAFAVYTYSGPPSNRQWHDVNNTIVYPQLSVAQGFFVVPSSGFNWVQSLTNQ
jgi:hypothetical protein